MGLLFLVPAFVSSVSDGLCPWEKEKLAWSCRRLRFNSWVRKISWRSDRLPTPELMGFPAGSAGKESSCNAEDLGLISGLGRSPGGGRGNPAQYSCLETPQGQRSLGAYSPRVAKSRARLSNSAQQHSPRSSYWVCSFGDCVTFIWRHRHFSQCKEKIGKVILQNIACVFLLTCSLVRARSLAGPCTASSRLLLPPCPQSRAVLGSTDQLSVGAASAVGNCLWWSQQTSLSICFVHCSKHRYYLYHFMYMNDTLRHYYYSCFTDEKIRSTGRYFIRYVKISRDASLRSQDEIRVKVKCISLLSAL